MLTIISSLAFAFSVSRGDVVTHWTFDIVENGASAELATGLDVDVVGATLQQGALHGCLYFDGVDDVASVQDIGSAQASVGSFAEGTISCWFRFDHSPSFMDIETIFYLGAENSYSSYGTSANCYELEIGHFSSQRRLYWTNILTQDVDTDVPLCWSTTDHLDTSRWYHIVSTTSANGTRIFLDDVEIFDPGACTWQFGDETTRRFLGDVIEQEVIWFGKGLWNDEHQFYEGAIDEFKIWNRAITPEEVHAEYE